MPLSPTEPNGPSASEDGRGRRLTGSCSQDCDGPRQTSHLTSRTSGGAMSDHTEVTGIVWQFSACTALWTFASMSRLSQCPGLHENVTSSSTKQRFLQLNDRVHPGAGVAADRWK